jgi:deoxyadenosine/deoxycytidine kinase
MSNNEYHIYIEGSIGAGKTTIVRMLEDKIKTERPDSIVNVYYEEPDKFTLKMFNTNPKAFETMFQISMIGCRWKNKVLCCEDSNVVKADAGIEKFFIHDTGFISNKAYIQTNRDMGFINNERYETLLSIDQFIEDDTSDYIKKPTHVILLDCNAERSICNIRARCRPSEETIKPEYLTTLSRNFKKIFNGIDHDNKYIIDVSDSFASVEDIYNVLVK